MYPVQHSMILKREKYSFGVDMIDVVAFIRSSVSPHGLTFTWWGCCGLCL